MWGSLTASDSWVHAGWTMLHYLWVGALLGLGAWACRQALRSASAGARYLVAIGWLGVLAAAPLAIAAWLDVPQAVRDPATLSALDRVEGMDVQAARPMAPGLQPRLSQPEPVPDGKFAAASSPWHAVVTFLPWLWLLGTPLTLAWSIAGLAGAERLRRLSSPPGDRRLEALCRRLAHSMKITRDVSILVCTRIAAPILVGIVRPVILLPPSLVTGLTPRQLEMVLIHELAHVRRWDNLVNLVQRMIESVLFFHPAVWLVSNWVRQEREHCCDELVVRRLGDRVSYAATLLAVVRKGLSQGRAGTRLAAGGGAISSVADSSLRLRLYRILGREEEETMQISRKLGALVPVVLLTAAVLAGSFGLSIGRAEPSEDSHPAVQPEAETGEAAEGDAGQRSDLEKASHGVFHELSVDAEPVHVPIDYIEEHDGSTYILLLSENLSPDCIRARDGSVWKPIAPMSPFPFEQARSAPGPVPRPSRFHPGGVNWGMFDRSEEYSETSPFRTKIVLPYELGEDYLLNQDPTMSPLFFSHDSSEPEMAAGSHAGEERPKPRAQGEIRWVNQPNKATWVNLGREDGLEWGTKFHVYGPGKKDAPLGEEKGAIVITQILGPHLAEARIVRDSPANPIIPGDQIHSPEWKGKREWVVTTYPRKFTATVAGGAEAPDSTAALRQEVEELRQQLRRLQQERDQLFNERVRLTDELDALRAERQKLEQAVKRAEESEKLKRFHEKAWPKPSVPQPHMEGVVLDVAAHGLIEISLGSDDGVRKGQRLEVYRSEKSTSVYVGRIEVLETRPDQAVCRILAGFLKRPIQKGDRVATKLRAEGGAAVSPFRLELDAPISRTISIDATGKVTVDGAELTLEELADLLSVVTRKSPPVRLLIAAHPDTKHERILEVLDACTAAGIAVVGIAVQDDEEDTGPPATEAMSETLHIDATGQITVNGAQLTLEALRDALLAAAKEQRGPFRLRLIAVHPDANHERVSEVINACKGVIRDLKIVVLGDEEETGPPATPAP